MRPLPIRSRRSRPTLPSQMDLVRLRFVCSVLAALFVPVVLAAAPGWAVRDAQAQVPVVDPSHTPTAPTPAGDPAAPSLPPPPVVVEPARSIAEPSGSASVSPQPATALVRTLSSERVLVDQLAGGPNRGAWGVSLQGGFPFFGLRALYGVAPGLAPLVEVETALGRRFTLGAGLSLAWVRRTHLRLSGEVVLGWLLQETELPRRGPSGELRLRLGIPTRRVMPYLIVGTRHAFLPSRTRIDRESGVETRWSVRHEWTPTASLGLGIHIHRRVGLDLGADYAWVDAPQSVAIPGFHLGLHVGGGR